MGRWELELRLTFQEGSRDPALDPSKWNFLLQVFPLQVIDFPIQVLNGRI